MPKTIAITPSWYWPESIDRVVGIPPFGVVELCVDRYVRDKPDAPALISPAGSMSFRELQTAIRNTSNAIAKTNPSKAVLAGDLNTDNVIRLLGALGAGVHTRILGQDEDAAATASAFGSKINLSDIAIDTSGEAEAIPMLGRHALASPTIGISASGKTANHSNRSLLAASISIASFLKPQSDRPWLAALPLSRWEGLLSVITPLYLGAPLVLCESADDGEAFAQAIEKHQPGYAVTDLSAANLATRKQKRAVRKVRGVLEGILLSTTGTFSAGDRQRVGKAFGCASLTMFGLAETGAMFVSHPQWYLDEAVGIPLTNAHVVPSDPRNGAPIQALWELVESAEVTVKGPTLMCGYEGEETPPWLEDGRFRTGIIASSDANGMIYVLPS